MGRGDSSKKGRSSCLEKLRAEHRRFQQEIACIRFSNDAFQLHGGDVPSHSVVAEDNLGSQAPSLPSPSCLAHSDLFHNRSQESVKKHCCENEKIKSFEDLPSSCIQKEQESAVERSEIFDHSTVTGEDDPCVLCTNSNGAHVNIRAFPPGYSSARRTGIGGGSSKDLPVAESNALIASEVSDEVTIRLTATTLFTANKGQILISSTASSNFPGTEFVKYLNSTHTEVTMQKHVDQGSGFPSESSCLSRPSSIIMAQTQEVLLSEKRMHGAPMERISLRNSPTLPFSRIPTRHRQESQVEIKGSNGEFEASNVKQQARGSNASQVTSSATCKAVGAEFLPSSCKKLFQRHEPFLASTSLNLDIGVVRCHCTLREPGTPTMVNKVVQVREGRNDPIECIHDRTFAPKVVSAHEAAASSSCMMEQQSVFLEEEKEVAATSVGTKERNGEKSFEHIKSALHLDIGLKNLESSNRARSALSRRLAGQIKHILETLDDSEPKIHISSTSGCSVLDNGLKFSSKSLEAKVNDPGKSLSILGRIPCIAMPRPRSQLMTDSKPEAAKATNAEMYLQEVVSALASKPRTELFGQLETKNLDHETGTLDLNALSTNPSLPGESSPKVTSLLVQTLSSEKTSRMIGAKTIAAIEKTQNTSSTLRVAKSEICAVLPSLLPSVDHNTGEFIQIQPQNQPLADEANGPSDTSEQSEISADAFCQQRNEYKSSFVRPASLENDIYTPTEILPIHMLHSEQKDSGTEHCLKSMTNRLLVARTSMIEKERNLQSVTDLVATESIAASTDTDLLRHTLAGEDARCTRTCTSWRTTSKARPTTSPLRNRDYEEFGLGQHLPCANDKLGGDNFPSDEFLQDCRRKVENFVKGSRVLENAAVQRRSQPSKSPRRVEKTKLAISSGTKGYPQSSNLKAKKGLQDTSRAVAAENLAHDIQVLMSKGKVTYPALTPKFGKSSNLDGSVAAAAQVVSQLTKDTSPKSTDDKWRKLVTVQEARLASAKNIIMNMIGGHFDYDQMYQELRELGDERIRIEQHEKAQRKLLCLPNSLVGASTKLAANNFDTPHGKKGKVLEDDGQNRRLRHGSMLADPKSGSSTKRRRSTQSPARETGNKLPRLGFVEIKLRENIYNDQNLKSALFNRDVKTYPATEKKYKLEGHSMHQLQTFSDKVANSMLWHDQSETLGIDMDVLAEKKFPTNHRQKKESAIFTRRKDKIPGWVERICKPMQNLCESHCKHAHEKFPVSSNLRRRSVRPPGAFFKVGKPINWMQQPMKVIKDEVHKRSEAASRCMERAERLSYPIEDIEANNPHKRDTKHLVERNIQQRMKDFQGKGHMTYVQKDIFSNMLNNSSSLLVDNKYYPSLQKIHSGIMPSLSVEDKPAVSAIFEDTLIKSSGSNLAVGKEIPDNGLDLQKVSEVSTAPKYLIIDSDKLKDRDKSTGAVSSASTCTIKGNGERPEEWLTVGDFGSEPNGSVAPICNPEIRVYGNAVAVLPEAASTSTVISPSLETAAEKASTSSESEIVGPEPGHACETMQHQQQPFDLDAENSRHLSQNEQKASCSTHVETKYSKQPSIGYRTQLEEEVLKRALLEVILQSMLNEDNQQPATGDLQNKDHPSDLVAVSKIASWSLGSSQKHGDMQSGQNQETVSSSQTSTLDLSPVIECQTDTQASPVTQPPHSDLSQPLQSAYSSRATAVISHGGSCSSIGLSVWPWPVPMYVTADGRITLTSQIPQFPLLQVSNNLCLSSHEASVALNQQVAVPITSTTIAVTQHPIIIPDSGLPNGSTKVHQEIAAGQERDLERPKEDFSSPRTLNTSLCLPQHEASLIPSFAPNSAIVPAESLFLDTPKCRDDGVIIAADAIARRYRPRQRARPGLRLEEMRSFTYRGSVDANEHCQEVFQAANERALEFGRKQLLSTEADPEEQGTALGKAAFDATSCRNMPLSESPCEEGMPGLKDKNKMDEEQEHATLECEHPIVQLGQSKQEIVVGVMTQTEDFLRRESATKNEMSSLPAKKHVIEGGDYSHNLTLQKSYFQSTKWTKEEQSQLAAWSSIKNFSLSDTSPEHLSEQSLQRDECFLSAGEVNSYELGRTLFPLVSEDSTSSSSNKISESFTSSSKDSSSATGTCIVKLGCVRCEPAVESEGLLLSEGEFESGTVAYNVEEVGQLHPQLYIEPGEMENKELAPVSKLDEGFLRPRFFHEEEAAGSMSEGEVLPGCLGERGEIRKF